MQSGWYRKHQLHHQLNVNAPLCSLYLWGRARNLNNFMAQRPSLALGSLRLRPTRNWLHLPSIKWRHSPSPRCFGAANHLCEDVEIFRKSITYLLTYSMEQNPSWEANRFPDSQEIPSFYGTQRFITAFRSDRHLSLSSTSSVQSIPPHPTSWRSILILSSHLRLSPAPSSSLRLPHQNPVQATLPHTRYMVRSSHSRFYYPHIIGWGIQIIQLLVM